MNVAAAIDGYYALFVRWLHIAWNTLPRPLSVDFSNSTAQQRYYGPAVVHSISPANWLLKGQHQPIYSEHWECEPLVSTLPYRRRYQR